MEALIVPLFGLVAILLLEAGHWIAIAVTRRAAVIAAGALAGWLAGRNGAAPLEALRLGVIVCLIARHRLKPRWRRQSSDEGWL